jgi:hypothetical protein
VTSGPTSLALYRGLLRLYPRPFRDEYGVDMADLFAEQLRDESGPRVWARGLLDLFLTVPELFMEAHMSKKVSPAIPLLFGSVSVAGLLTAVVGGTNLGMLAVGLAVAAAAAVLAAVASRRAQPIAAARSVTSQWWKLLGAGVAIIVGFAVVTTATGQLGDGAWVWAMAVLLSAITLVGAGVVLGITRLVTHNGSS